MDFIYGYHSYLPLPSTYPIDYTYILTFTSEIFQVSIEIELNKVIVDGIPY